MKNLIKSMLFSFFIMSFCLTVNAGISKLPHVFNLSFDDKSDPGKDESDNGNKGELKGAAKWTDQGHTGGGVEFDGIDSHVEIVVDVPEKNFTMGVWIKTDQGDVGIYSVLDGAAGDGGHDRHFFLKDGNVNFRTWKGAGWATEKNVADGEWHHIALVAQDGVGQIAYVDGVEVGKNDYDHSDFDWQKRVWVGFSNDAGNDYFKGTIDDATYTAAALTADQVKMKLMVTNVKTAVEPEAKLVTVWGNIKKSNTH